MDTEPLSMSLRAKKEYLANIHGRYQRAGREHKSKILDEFCAVCAYHRKFALRLLNRPLHRRRRRPGPKPRYDQARLLPALKQVWLLADQPCGKLLKASLALWLPFLEELSPAIQKELLAMSAATLDRWLKPARFQHRRRGLCTTKPGKLLRHHVPLRDGPADTQHLGHIEADTVAHCGDSVAGDFIYSLTFTDVCTGWTEIRATWNKSAHGVLEQLQDIEQHLPFRMKSFHADNGSEFLNWPLWNYLQGPKRKVPFTRSRAYRKNDNAPRGAKELDS
jgi:IS30 family transposase